MNTGAIWEAEVIKSDSAVSTRFGGDCIAWLADRGEMQIWGLFIGLDLGGSVFLVDVADARELIVMLELFLRNMFVRG